MSTAQLKGAHCSVAFPIDGDSQESGFANATLQSTSDPGRTVEFSVAAYVDVDPRRLLAPAGAPAVVRVATALQELFEWLGSEVERGDGPVDAVRFEVQVGPCGDGDAVDVPAEDPARRSFTVSVPEGHRATIAMIERLGDRPGVDLAEEQPAPGAEPDTGGLPQSTA